MTSPIDDAGLLASLRAGTLESLNHEQHVRVAWALCRRGGLAGMLAELRDLLRRFTTRKGHPDKYHETITVAFACLIQERVARDPNLDWTSFAAANSDLFDPQVIRRFYSDELLSSDLARRTFLFSPLARP